ncbi:MAG: hydroxyacylglutathione hydrolase [Leptospiraceae bacterium]|nr:hydroxyacylglutathione hydrolase [Leptospiraceae bacterium]
MEKIYAQNALQNYNYLIYDRETKDCLIVDPLKEELLIATIKTLNLNPQYIVNTHEHLDHTSGNSCLCQRYSVRVVVHESLLSKVPHANHPVQQGDSLSLGSDQIAILYTPGHTLGHICLYVPSEPPMLFCGDTLFHGGVGNCYHGGDVEQLYETFEKIIFKIPRSAQVFPGHRYLERNLLFGLSILPDDHYLRQAYEAWQKTHNDIRTVADEFESNLFFRLDDPSLRRSLYQKKEISSLQCSNKEVFLALRRLRDRW